MLTCKQCGTQVEDGVMNCANCGAPIEAPVQQNQPIDLSEKFNEFNNTADTTAEYDAQDIEKNKVMAVLAYILFFIPLLAAKDSKFARFHTNQGLVLFLGGIIASVVAVIPVSSDIFWTLSPSFFICLIFSLSSSGYLLLYPFNLISEYFSII